MALASITNVLAVWGALTGTIGATLALATFIRDRPRLVLLVQVKTSTPIEGGRRGEPRTWLICTAVNHGRQPVAVIRAGVAGGELKLWRRRRSRKKQVLPFELSPPDDALPRSLAPGETYEWSCDISGRPAHPPVERAFVISSRNKVVWGEWAKG